MPLNNDQRQTVISLLPKYLSPERFLSLCLTAEKNYALQKCEPASILNCFIQAAEVGLEPNTPLGHCYLVPFQANNGKTYAQLIIGWRGLIHLASMASGARVEAHVVHMGERLVWRPTDRRDPIIHEPYMDADDDDIDSIVGAYAIAFLRNGETQAEWMSRAQIDRIQKGSKAQGKDSPWQKHFAEMGRKCPTRRLGKYLQLTGHAEYAERFGKALEVDNLFDTPATEQDIPPAQLTDRREDPEPKKRGRPPTPPAQNKAQTPANNGDAAPSTSQSVPPVVCAFCKQEGHESNACPNVKSESDSGVGKQDKPADLGSASGGSNPPPGTPSNDDAAISAFDYTSLSDEARKAWPKRTMTKLIEVLEQNFGINDLAELKVSQIPKLQELMQTQK